MVSYAQVQEKRSLFSNMTPVFSPLGLVGNHAEVFSMKWVIPRDGDSGKNT
jgi:hypothetical protein